MMKKSNQPLSIDRGEINKYPIWRENDVFESCEWGVTETEDCIEMKATPLKGFATPVFQNDQFLKP